jgi:glutaminyl-peptide cyclotransferase
MVAGSMRRLALAAAGLALVAEVAVADHPASLPSAAAPTPVTLDATPRRMRVKVVRTLPHDPTAFTQGLLIHAGTFYESTGIQGQSSLRNVEIGSGKVLRRLALDRNVFAEGLALAGDRLVQLTWTSGKAFVYDLFSFRKIGELPYAGEGWGLCFDGEHLVMSNGTDRLSFRDAQTFAVARELAVTRAGTPLSRLNELECVGDLIYANVWTRDQIVAIDHRSGKVVAEIDAAGLLTPAESDVADVLNGIAHDKRSGRFFITGKYWPKVFEVEFVDAPASSAGGN